ncbi:hypothetical protein HKX48_002067, partial [Thoreauomyces humboldtii]
MIAATAFALLVSCSAIAVSATPVPDADTRFPYNGPTIPVGDWINPGAVSNGKGFPRLVEPPAVTPNTKNPTNNVNVISLALVPEGMNVHYQTPFGLGVAPTIIWGESPTALSNTASGTTRTYNRTPQCTIMAVTQCSQFFHDVQITGLKAGHQYYYQIQSANGTTTSDVLTFKTALPAGDSTPFSIGVLADMGYTNAMGTFKELRAAVDNNEISAVWHGGDISYADDWYSGILPCQDDWPVCYNGTGTHLPGGLPIPDEYLVPLPAGEVPNQGGPNGGDMSSIYESNWDLWQQWFGAVSSKVPYMVLPGNHEASCGEFDGPGNVLTALLEDGKTNSTAPKSALTYYSCPESQRNFTAFQNRFRMPGAEVGGKSNFWYSYEYGLAHFVSIDAETDIANSPEWTFHADIPAKKVGTETLPLRNETEITDAGPFGKVGDYKNNTSYEQLQWLERDLAAVDRTKTPWLVVMSHRPMYSSEASSYQKAIRAAFEALFIKYKVDVYIAGHIHWYERLLPLSAGGIIDTSAIKDNNTYIANGKSITHLINGQAGNIESHSYLNPGQTQAAYTAVLDAANYGFSKLSVVDAKTLKW